jgi:hypothetical protein
MEDYEGTEFESELKHLAALGDRIAKLGAILKDNPDGFGGKNLSDLNDTVSRVSRLVAEYQERKERSVQG